MNTTYRVKEMIKLIKSEELIEELEYSEGGTKIRNLLKSDPKFSVSANSFRGARSLEARRISSAVVRQSAAEPLPVLLLPIAFTAANH